MLAKRIIPTVLVRGKVAFKGPGFGEKCTRSVGSALAICRTHAKRGVDELLILDIGATPEGRGPDLELVSALAADCYIPITVGGGVKTLGDIDALLRAGADKVAIGQAVRDDPALIRAASDRFGRQAIVAIVECDSWQAAGVICKAVEMLGAGEIVLQSVERESTMCSYDLDAVRAASCCDVPLIVSGGCGGAFHMFEAFAAGADAVAAGALFQFTDDTPKDCARYLKANGVEVRL